MLRSFLREGDHFLLDFGLYPEKRSEDFWKKLVSIYAEAAYYIGVRSLAACGAQLDHKYIFTSIEGDDEEPTVQVLRVFYRFPEETVLTVGRDQVVFQEGERLQILESRRFLFGHIERHLRKYDLGVAASQYLEKNEMLRGVFLCSWSISLL